MVSTRRKNAVDFSPDLIIDNYRLFKVRKREIASNIQKVVYVHTYLYEI